IAVTQQATTRSSRANIGTATEVIDYLRLLIAKIGTTVCYQCGRHVKRDNPDSVVKALAVVGERVRFMLTFPAQVSAPSAEPASDEDVDLFQELREDGFVRVIVGEHTIRLGDEPTHFTCPPESWIDVVVDRLTGGTSESRLRDSLETAFSHGEGRATVFIDAAEMGPVEDDLWKRGSQRTIDGKAWIQIGFNQRLVCEDCGITYTSPTPKLFSFNSPLGACPTCEGFGNLIDIDMDLVVPDPSKTLREGAIAPWNTPSYAHELEELLALAGDYELPLDVPFRELQPTHLELIQNGVSEREFGGLRGFFAWLEKRKYKMHLRVFLNRWRSYNLCPDCQGARLRQESLATRIGGKNIAEIC
ncbi:MAG: hypothetical protein ACE1ZA_01505, partial [Pseudomonadales bacterium]